MAVTTTTQRGDMDRRHAARGPLGPVTALVASALTVTAACTALPPEGGAPESSGRSGVEIPREGASPASAASTSASTSSFTLFESGQVRPLAMSPDGRRLFAVNTPDNRLEIFSVGKRQLVHTASIPVGL